MDRMEEALEVIRGTHDGEDLSPGHLYLVECVVNGGDGCLTDEGRAAWEKIVADVRGGTYVAPWLHGIEHLRKNHGGYVFWRGVEVEHYSFRGPGAPERERQAALRLAEACRRVEARGEKVTGFASVTEELDALEPDPMPENGVVVADTAAVLRAALRG